MTTKGRVPGHDGRGGGEGDGGGRRRGHARWLLGAFVLSVSLNLVWAGGMIGDAMRGHMEETGGKERLFAKFLPENHRDAWHRALAEIEPDRARLRREMAGVHERIITIIRGQPFEREALSAAFTDRRHLNTSLREGLHEAVVHVASGMTASERGMLADQLDGLAERWAERHESAAHER
ncbi:MAG: periplasmic heavy metal sensor [Paracoccaceae bacterium]